MESTSQSGKVRIGVFGIGLEAYWSQFPGLKTRLEGSLHFVEQHLQAPRRDIINLGLIDTPERALAAGHQVRREDIDFLILYVTTYAQSSTVLPLVRRAKVPVLVLNMQPRAVLDYASFNALSDRNAMTGEWLAYCSACAVPEIANVFGRAGIPFHQVTGFLHGDPDCWAEIEGWVQAAEVAHRLSHTRVGLMGHYYSGMLDIATDITAICSTFGVHMEMVELDELTNLRLNVATAEVQDCLTTFAESFDILPDCSKFELERAARTAVALDRFLERRRLDALAYFYKGTGVEQNEDTITSIILGASLATARGVPVAGEYEIKNVLAMKIVDSFGAGGSFTEYYMVDFNDDIVLMGHDGPGHTGIADGKTRVRPLQLYHGKVGKGLSVEMSVKPGPVTLLSIAENRGSYKLIVAHGHVESGPILQIGNTNSRYRFHCGARTFVERWNAEAPAHHCAVGIGHMGSKLAKLAAILQLEIVEVC
jgi:L-arabinose isomerase